MEAAPSRRSHRWEERCLSSKQFVEACRSVCHALPSPTAGLPGSPPSESAIRHGVFGGDDDFESTRVIREVARVCKKFSVLLVSDRVDRSEQEIRLMKNLKDMLDPKGLLNPGKLFE